MSLAQTLCVDERRLGALPALTEPLLGWYDSNARRLPWRENPTPYRVWISEIMLQQTRVEAVRGYYERFLAALPDVPSLAAAPEQTLLKLWEGLGYYSRARNLQKAARIVVEQYDGVLPASFAQLRALPGIGVYTAGAIASIAYGIRVPAPDGNVYRVLSRILGSRADIALGAVKQALGAAAASMLPADRPGDFNQAVMDLGATVCLSSGPPLCERCPVAESCAARADGCAEQLPVSPAKKPRRIEMRTIVLVCHGRRLLVRRRVESGLLRGMYEPLNLPGSLDAEQVRGHLRMHGAGVEKLVTLRDAKHIFSHVEWRMRGYFARCAAFAPPQGMRWADERELGEEIALPSAFGTYTGELRRLLEVYGP